MARKGENIYKRKDGRYEGRYIKDYDLQGKGIIGYVYGKTYKEAKEKLLIAKAKVKQRYNKPPSETLVKDWFEKWLLTQKHIKNHHIRCILRSLKTILTSNLEICGCAILQNLRCRVL